MSENGQTAAGLLDQLDDLRAAATPGPWEAWNRGVGWHIVTDDPATVELPDTPRPLPEGFRTDLYRGEDARFIAAAMNAVDPLVAALRAVLALHKPEPGAWDDTVCATCLGSNEEQLPWPCDTYRTVAAALTDGTPR